MATVLDLGVAALQDLGVLGVGETPSGEDQQYILDTLNRLIDQAAAERLTMHKVTQTPWTITSSDGTYTVGPGADINIPYPTYIQGVNYADTSVSPPVEVQLIPLTDEGYRTLTPKTLTNVYPTSWYFDHGYTSSGSGNGYGSLILWPTPTSSTLVGVIYVATQVAEFTATSEVVALPKGYREWIVTELAARMATAFDRTQLLPRLESQVDRARRILKASNTRLADLSVDPAVLRWRRYSIFTDQT